MRRPLVSLACALTLGIIAGGLWDFPPAAVLAFAAALTAVTVLLHLLRKPPAWAFLATCLAFALVGAGYVRVRELRQEASPLARILNEDAAILRVRGTIAERPAVRVLPPRRPGDGPRHRTDFPLSVSSVRVGDDWRAISGRLQLLVEGRADHVLWGDEVEAVLSAWRPSPSANPGEFDYAGYLRLEGTSGTAAVPVPEGVHILNATGGFHPLRRFEAYRRAVTRRLEQELPEGPARVLQCLLLGERAALDDAGRRAFRESGTLHFLAISGLHVGLVAAFVWYALLFCRARLRVAAAGVIAAVLAYAALTGFQPSVVRATIMCALICGGFLLYRKPNVPSSLALAWVLVLLLDPADLYRPGFQLSFAAVLGIWLFALPLERALFRVRDELDRLQAPEERAWYAAPRWMAQKMFSVSLAAWLATVPLLAYHFGAITPLAPFASMLLLPIVWATILIGLPGALLLPAAPLPAKLFLWPAAAGAQAMEAVSAVVAKVPGATLRLPSPGWSVMLLCALAALAIGFRRRINLQSRGVFALAALPVAAYMAFSWPASPPRRLTVQMLAVGQGNCVLLRFPDGKDLLYDAGSAGSNVGERTILPALRALGVRRIDAIVLSHGDADHVNGFRELARGMTIGRVILSPHFRASADSALYFAEVLEDRSDLLVASAGDRIGGFGDARIEVLWPPKEVPALKLSENELSLVLRVKNEDGSVLLTGDFGRGAAELLLDCGGNLRADVLQAPHHGLPDPSASRIAKAVGAKLVLVSGEAAGAAPYADSGAILLATEDHGMITVEMENGTPRATTFRRAD
jgi:competence protein ComEC